jgi:hypothetical protein
MADERDPASAAPPEASWADYYQHTLGRELRPPFVRGIRVLQKAGVRPAQAIEVGFGMLLRPPGVCAGTAFRS